MKNYLSKFKENLDEILEDFRDNGIRYKITKDYTKSFDPTSDIVIKFTRKGLKRWYMGISGAGPDSNHYVAEQNSMIVYLFHSWVFDKWSPWRADLRFDLTNFNVIRGSDQYMEMINILCGINENPIKYYIDIIYESKNIKYPRLAYLKDWYYYVIKFPFSDKLRYDWSPLWLYYVLKFISWFDPRCKTSKIFKESNTIPKYTFGFLATEKCSGNDKSFENFYHLYTTWPNKLKYKFSYKLFDAIYNVSDYFKNFTDKEINSRLRRGIML